MANTTKKEPVIIPIDLGFGFSKYGKIINSEMTYDYIPSLAPRATGVDMSMGIVGKRNTIKVNVDGTDYEVGPDSIDLDSSENTRTLNDQYIFTDQYKAISLGLFYYIGEPEIDLLVVGLPVSNLYNSEKLKDILIGEHQVTGDFKVNVKEVLVIPQPLGGLYHCLSLNKEELEFIKEEKNLIIDPGFLTFDFLMTNGDKVIETKSDAHPGGVTKILKSIAESISNKTGKKYDNYNAIDRGLRKRKIKVSGKVEDLAEHIKNTLPVIESSVTYMQNIVGDGSDIDNIILIGGGSSVFERTIKKHYPDHEIIVIEDPQYANVKGFYEAGKAYYGSKWGLLWIMKVIK